MYCKISNLDRKMVSYWGNPTSAIVKSPDPDRQSPDSDPLRAMACLWSYYQEQRSGNRTLLTHQIYNYAKDINNHSINSLIRGYRLRSRRLCRKPAGGSLLYTPRGSGH